MKEVGFRQKKSTVDRMFILKTIIDRFLFIKRFNCMFVDFSKAFNTVNRNYLSTLLLDKIWHAGENGTTDEGSLFKC